MSSSLQDSLGTSKVPFLLVGLCTVFVSYGLKKAFDRLLFSNTDNRKDSENDREIRPKKGAKKILLEIGGSSSEADEAEGGDVFNVKDDDRVGGIDATGEDGTSTKAVDGSASSLLLGDDTSLGPSNRGASSSANGENKRSKRSRKKSATSDKKDVGEDEEKTGKSSEKTGADNKEVHPKSTDKTTSSSADNNSASIDETINVDIDATTSQVSNFIRNSLLFPGSSVSPRRILAEFLEKDLSYQGVGKRWFISINDFSFSFPCRPTDGGLMAELFSTLQDCIFSGFSVEFRRKTMMSLPICLCWDEEQMRGTVVVPRHWLAPSPNAQPPTLVGPETKSVFLKCMMQGFLLAMWQREADSLVERAAMDMKRRLVSVGGAGATPATSSSGASASSSSAANTSVVDDTSTSEKSEDKSERSSVDEPAYRCEWPPSNFTVPQAGCSLGSLEIHMSPCNVTMFESGIIQMSGFNAVADICSSYVDFVTIFVKK